jgi:acyl-CoA dehydrogenase
MTVSGEELDLLAETASRILAPRCTPEQADRAIAAGWDRELWDALEEHGLTRFAADLDVADGAWHAAMEVAVQAGKYAAAAPVIETQVAAWLLERCAVDAPDGPLSVSFDGFDGAGAGLARRVPYGQIAAAVVVADTGRGAIRIVRAPTRPPTGPRSGANLAGEPRADIAFGQSGNRAGARQPAPPFVIDTARALLRLLRAAQILGAAERCLDLTTGYVRERHQFGRALAAFQAVQQQVAIMAGETALIRAATDGAVTALAAAETAGVGDARDYAFFAVDSAKAQAGAGATKVARIAHQMHGAIGTTREHALRLATTRMWAWSAEDGSESELCAAIGAAALAAKPGTLWAAITRLILAGRVRGRPGTKGRNDG